MAETSNPSGSATAALAPGTVLQRRYGIQRLLGGGGMGMVYLATDQRLANRPCAIKEMVDHFIDQAQRIEANEYFAREADTLAQLKHQSIPAITDRFDDQNRHYLVMEYVAGRNLEEELAAAGAPLPEGLVIDIARQLCDVLAYLHGHEPPIIYRDMKPSNVMLTPQGRAVLIDFGIARLFKAARKGTMIGTLGFAPPEQYQGNVDPRSDLYSLAATLHYVLTGRDPEKFPPFSFPPLKQLRPDVSNNLAGAIDAALAYDINRRPASVQDFRDMILYGRGLGAGGAYAVSPRGGTADLSLAALEPPRRLRRARKPRSAARRAIALAVVTLMLGGAAFGATYIYSRPQLQAELGIKPLIDALPWKHEELIARAREHPLVFQNVTLALSTREGTSIGPPQASFTDAELTNARYLKWDATFKNALAGLEARSDKVRAAIVDPTGVQIAMSDASQFVGPSQQTADFSGVMLMPNMTEKSPGDYKLRLSLDDQIVADTQFSVTQDLAARKAAADAAAAAAAAAKAEEQRRKQEAQRLAMIEERRSKPLSLRHIELLNTTKTGSALSKPTTSFDGSKVLFVGWRITFENRLFGLEPSQYRVDAAYIAPDGRALGEVTDWQNVSSGQRTVTFTGRVGNSRGGAFLPGSYTINFYLNGQYFSQKRFTVLADTGPYVSSPGGGLGGSVSSPPGGLSGPTLATGKISGLPGGGASSPLELRLRPQPNGFLHGEMVIRHSGFGLTQIEGFIRGNRLQFQVPYGTEIYYFEGKRKGDNLSGSFESQPSLARGTWTARTD
jgi:serine/threonine protein kinase